jgi:hypothetical protein
MKNTIVIPYFLEALRTKFWHARLLGCSFPIGVRDQGIPIYAELAVIRKLVTDCAATERFMTFLSSKVCAHFLNEVLQADGIVFGKVKGRVLSASTVTFEIQAFLLELNVAGHIRVARDL